MTTGQAKSLSIVFACSLMCGHLSEVQRRPRITGISHIGLDEDNQDGVRHFYSGLLGWPEEKGLEQPGAIRFLVNTQQYVEIVPTGDNLEQPEMDHVAFATDDAQEMLRYLCRRHVTVPEAVTKDADGTRRFMVRDPEGNKVEFVQSPHVGKPTIATDDEVSTQLIHVGLATKNPVAQNRFYKDILGFHLFWSGWVKEGHTDWIAMQVPEGTAWIEYMLNIPPNAKRNALGATNHFSCGVVSIDEAIKRLAQHGFNVPPRNGAAPIRDGKHKQNLYDPGGLRVELMEFQPVQNPCCTRYTGNQPSASDVKGRKPQ